MSNEAPATQGSLATTHVSTSPVDKLKSYEKPELNSKSPAELLIKLLGDFGVLQTSLRSLPANPEFVKAVVDNALQHPRFHHLVEHYVNQYLIKLFPQPEAAPPVIGLKAELLTDREEGAESRVTRLSPDHPTRPNELEFWVPDDHGTQQPVEYNEMTRQALEKAYVEFAASNPTVSVASGQYFYVRIHQLTDRPTDDPECRPVETPNT